MFMNSEFDGGFYDENNLEMPQHDHTSLTFTSDLSVKMAISTSTRTNECFRRKSVSQGRRRFQAFITNISFLPHS